MKHRAPAFLVLLGGLAPAQANDALPRAREALLAPGGQVDLDTTVVLQVPKEPPYVADLRFDRDGLGFFLEARLGAQRGSPSDEQPPSDGWSTEPLRLPDGRRSEPPAVWFVRTDCGSVARVEVMIGSTYKMGGTILRWVLAPAQRAVFRDGPGDLRFRRAGKAIELTWSGSAPEYRVVLEGGKAGSRTLVAKSPRITLDSLAPDEVHRARVHAISADGVASLPSEIAFLGSPRNSKTAVVEYPDRWYDAPAGGGLSLLRAEADATSCEVVLFLYGVYVRGGGVQKLGKGEGAWLQADELPEGGYRPVYDRLDDHDVHALRLPDGRYAKLWLEPAKAADLRSGMRVHFAFLEGGGRHFLACPGEVRWTLAPAGLELTWQPASGAARYRVVREGVAGGGELVGAPRLTVKGLEAERFHRFRVSAIDAAGDESAPRVVEAHTYGPGFRVGRCELDYGDAHGVELKTDERIAFARGEKPDPRLDLVITSSAGGCSSLTLTTPHGAMATGGRPFGEFPKEMPESGFAARVDTDDRRPESRVLWVKTADGSLACVRLSDHRCPKVLFEYVVRRVR